MQQIPNNIRLDLWASTIHLKMKGAIVVIWYLDLQLPMQSVPITTNIVSLNPAQAMCTRYNIMW